MTGLFLFGMRTISGEKIPEEGRTKYMKTYTHRLTRRLVETNGKMSL